MMTEKIRLMIAEDQALIREALASMLAQETDMDVVATAADGEQAIRLSRANRPDVILMDLQMPRVDGIPATREIFWSFRLPKL